MKKKLFFVIFFILCLFNIIAQVSDFSVLNKYKYLVIKPQNTHIEFSSSAKSIIEKKLAERGFKNIIDQSALYSSNYNQCEIVTCEFNLLNFCESSGEISSELNFFDCNYIIVKTAKEKGSFSFFTEKNCLKLLNKHLLVFDSYTYTYQAPKEKVIDQVSKEKIVDQEVPKEKIVVQAPKEKVIENNISLASQETTEEQPKAQYRGSGDPLKGLNVSKSKEMVIGKYYALIIGIDNYKGIFPPLSNAVSDAKAIEKMLTKYKFDVFHPLYNEQATREKIIGEFEWLVANVKEQDNVFIYYSGHGEYKQELNKGFWVPVDAEAASTSKYVSNNDIQTFLTGIKSKHTLLVSDACFSGDIFRGNTISVPFEESEKYYKEVHGLVSRQAMTSGGIEPVMDGGKDGHSIFAYYFLKTLNENASKYFDASQLYNKIKIPVINNSEQSPKLAPVKGSGDEGGQFIFIKK